MGAGHKVERALVGTAIDGVLRYVNKNPEDRQEALLKLVDTVQRNASGQGLQMGAVCEPSSG